MKKEFLAIALLTATTFLHAETIGEVSTAFKLIGPDHKVVIDVFDDPKIDGIACYVSRAKSGGVMGAIGLSEDKSESSVACRQVGTIRFKEAIKNGGEEVFSEKHSLIFKHMRIVRFPDAKRNSVVYLVYSDRLIDGSPKNSITAVNLPSETKLQIK